MVLISFILGEKCAQYLSKPLSSKQNSKDADELSDELFREN